MSFSALCALAYACALSDHIGLALFPHQALFRIAGRLAFPLFCFLVTECFEHTGNRRRYALTLLLLGENIHWMFFVNSSLDYSLISSLVIVFNKL